MPILDRQLEALLREAIVPTLAQGLLDRLIYDKVRGCIDQSAIFEIERSIALQLGRSPSITDEPMLAWSSALVAKALQRLVSDYEQMLLCDDCCEVMTRYENALSRVAVGE